MEEELDFARILEGHEGEIFYMRIGTYGLDVIYEGLNERGTFLIFKEKNGEGRAYELNKDWKCTYLFNSPSGIAPSRDVFYEWSRDSLKVWSEWDLAHNPRPKTWNQLETKYKHLINKSIYAEIKYKENISDLTPIQKSCLALLKLNQLIEFGYGGNPTNSELNLNKTYYITSDFCISTMCDLDRKQMICFRNKYQAEEFLKHIENQKLVAEYYNREVSWR